MSSRQADHSVRWLATIQLKNTVTRHWRQRADSRHTPGLAWFIVPVHPHMLEPREFAEPARPGRGGITDSEKAYLRGKLLTLIDQDDTQARTPTPLLQVTMPCTLCQQVLHAWTLLTWPSRYHEAHGVSHAPAGRWGEHRSSSASP